MWHRIMYNNKVLFLRTVLRGGGADVRARDAVRQTILHHEGAEGARCE